MHNHCPAPDRFLEIVAAALEPRSLRARVIEGFRAGGAVDPRTAQARSNAFFGIARDAA